MIAVVAGYCHRRRPRAPASSATSPLPQTTRIFGQTGPKVGSFDAGYGAALLARVVGHKKAREIWYLCRQYTAQEALEMGLVNTVVPLERLEEEAVSWAREILEKSPTAIRFLKAAFNADTDGLAGLQQFAGDATLLYYLTDEAKEGRNAFWKSASPTSPSSPVSHKSEGFDQAACARLPRCRSERRGAAKSRQAQDDVSTVR